MDKKWSIAYGIAKFVYENGAKLMFSYMEKENKEKNEKQMDLFMLQVI